MIILSTQCTQTDNDLSSIPKTSKTKSLIKFRLFNKIFSRQNDQSKKLVQIQKSYHSYRPYFTYWVTFVQILVCIVSLMVYGYAPLASTQSVNNYFSKIKKPELNFI